MLAAHASAQDAGKPLMRVYFIPFAVETSTPVTTADIEEAGFYRLVLARSPNRSPREPVPPLVSSLPAMLRAHPTAAKLEELFIRLKVEVGETTYHVDNKGTVRESTSGRTFQLTKREMERLGKDIVGLRGVVDLDVCHGLSKSKRIIRAHACGASVDLARLREGGPPTPASGIPSSAATACCASCCTRGGARRRGLRSASSSGGRSR
jgi:hypothetical protein